MVMTMSVIDKLFPQQANNNYRGSPIAQYVFYALMAMYSLRSIVHFTTEDGGINKIASIVIFPLVQTAEGTIDPNNVIYLFASLWGSAQILMLLMFFVCMWRYRNLLPLLWLTVVIEIPMRMIANLLHPLNANYYEHVPPGSVSNIPLLTIACIMFVLSLRQRPA